MVSYARLISQQHVYPPCNFFNTNDEIFKAISNIPPGNCHLEL
jgi:hypothetical protein